MFLNMPQKHEKSILRNRKLNMKTETCTHPSFKVVGLTARTNNFKYEGSHETSRIFPVVRDFVHQKIANKISGRTEPGTLICAYYDYESDYKGDYTYFIGEKVEDSITSAPSGLTLIEIPEQKYLKVTNGPDSMPNVVKDPWKKVWAMEEDELKGKRSYKIDWELYDERASDHSAIILDIFVGLKVD